MKKDIKFSTPVKWLIKRTTAMHAAKSEYKKSQKLKLYTCINKHVQECVFSMFTGQSQNSYKNKDDAEKHKQNE